jgi:hypothetical protein
MSGPERLMPRPRAAGLGVCLFGLGLISLGCSTDTAGLARRAPVAAGGASDEPGANASAGTSSGAASASAGAGGASEGLGEVGEGAIDVVHGVVDGGSLLVCLWSVASGQVLGEDTPESGGGVAYGQSLRLPTAWDLSQAVDVELFVSAAASFRCSDLRASAVDGNAVSRIDADAGGVDAGAPEPPPFPLEPLVPRRAGSLRLSPGVVRAGVHYALVATGCTSPGGSPSEAICGAPDPLFESQQALILAELASGPTDGGLGLQFLNASRGVSRADLVLQGDSQRQSIRLTNDVQFGSVRPRDAVPVQEPLGVELHVEGATQSSYTQAWADTVSTSGDPLVPGENHLLVFVGPAPGAAAPGVAEPRFVLIRGY